MYDWQEFAEIFQSTPQKQLRGMMHAWADRHKKTMHLAPPKLAAGWAIEYMEQ